MSYSYPRHIPLVPIPALPPPQALSALGQAHYVQSAPLQAQPAGNDAFKKLLGALALVVVILVVLYLVEKYMTRGGSGAAGAIRKNPVRRMSTAELAKNLYERLERRGGANPTVMRSLQSYASPRK